MPKGVAVFWCMAALHVGAIACGEPTVSPDGKLLSGPDASGSPGPSGDSGTSPRGTPEDAGGAVSASGNEPALKSHAYAPIDDEISNPERGFWSEVPLVDGDFSKERSKGFSLSHSYVRLDAFRASALDATLLTALQSGFDRARVAGVKVVPRFTYNFGQGDPDAPLNVIVRHIGQLKPLLSANADVLATLQAGFVGAWGEWHHSTNGLDDDKNRAAVLDALLAALPASRFVQLRYPYHKSAIVGPITSALAFGTTSAARVGEHNDCFLASADDEGTYFGAVDTWKTFVAQDGRYSPIGGETCKVNPPRSDCATALAELDQLHWSFLNHDFEPNVVQSWISGGCYPEIRRRLGYRFSLSQKSA